MRMPTLTGLAVRVALTAGGLAACTGVPILSVQPGPNGALESSARADTEQLAFDGAADIARAACAARKQQHMVLERRARSLGLPQRTEQPAVQAAQLARYVGGIDFPSLSATQDIEARVAFRCVERPVAATPATHELF